MVVGRRWKVLLAGPPQAVLQPRDAASPKGLMLAVPIQSRVHFAQAPASPKGLMLAVPVQSRVYVVHASSVAAAVAAAVAAVGAAAVETAGVAPELLKSHLEGGITWVPAWMVVKASLVMHPKVALLHGSAWVVSPKPMHGSRQPASNRALAVQHVLCRVAACHCGPLETALATFHGTRAWRRHAKLSAH